MNDGGIMKFDLSNILNISARICGAVLIVCIFLLFFPVNWLPFAITLFREQYGLWIFIVLVISAALLLSYIIKWIIDKLKKTFEKKQMWATYKYILKNLSDAEKEFLKAQYKKRETAIIMDLSNPMIKHMETLKVLSLSSGTIMSRAPLFPGFIQPWVFELIDKNPKYIETEDKSDDR